MDLHCGFPTRFKIVFPSLQPARNPWLLSDRLDIRLIHFDSHGAHDQIKRENQAALVLAAPDDALESLPRTATDADAASHAQVWMWLNVGIGLPVSQTFDFLFRQGGGLAVEGHDPDRARNLQYLQLVVGRDADEDVAGKQRQL